MVIHAGCRVYSIIEPNTTGNLTDVLYGDRTRDIGLIRPTL